MTWEGFYLICFFVGLVLALLTWLSGAHLHFHLPIHVHWAHGIHVTGTHPHGGVGPVNGLNLVVFLTCFGGAGLLLTHYRTPAALIGLVLSFAAAFGITGIFYLGMVRTLSAQENALRAEDFEMMGVLGRLSFPIRDGGTGELIYDQAGTRRSCGARSESGSAIPKGTEVVVMRYEGGIAYVRPWSELHLEA